MKRTTCSRLTQLALLGALVSIPAQAHAQLDPLLFLKTTQPNVIIAVDTANRMQRDADNVYYDPGTYAKTSSAFEAVLGLLANQSNSSYRRKYHDLRHINPNENAGAKFRATRISTVGDLQSGYSTFYERTKLAIARRALVQAITDNASSARFALLRTRQANPTLPAAGNEKPVLVDEAAQQTPTDDTTGKWKITRTTVSSNNSTQTTTGLLTAADASGANTTILTTLGRNLGTAGALLPAGNDASNTVDAPVGLMLDDARSHALSLINADTAAGGCRNTIVVLVVGGGEGTINPQDVALKASSFLAVGARRVPVYVVALMPAASDVTTLRAIAANSGGQYFEITAAMVNAVAAGSPVPEVVRAINTAVQHAFVPSTTFNVAPTEALPFGPSSEPQVTSPIVGTADLRGASKMRADGSLEVLPDSETYIFNGTARIPQRSNVLVTTGFALPGFEGRLRAFRVYKPVPDTTKPSGYKFTQDGSPLWIGSTPAPGSRNIFTVLPGSSTLVPFTSSNAAALTPYLGVTDAPALIEFIRAQKLGAVVGSTPAFLDPPSLDPPPDADYPGFVADNEDRRSLIFVGANDGMMHAIDARTGMEVFAFIPFNLLPKLKALPFGQSLDAFRYFVDSSPKIADVKTGGRWRTFLFFGQGPGGTFYNALDVTLDNMGGSISPTSADNSALLTYFASPSRIAWKWSFPRNTSFDATRGPYGELSAGASATEQSVGETWSDPAVGQVQDDTGPYVMVTGSGFLKFSTQNTYRTGVTRAGTTFYVLDVGSGAVLGTPRDVGSDSQGERVDDCRAANDCRRIKNALQMDPVATGLTDQRFITKVYIGDLDGRVWRFALTKVSSTNVSVSTPTMLYNAGSDYPLFASMATVNVGATDHYIFVGSGSDLLPSNGVNQPYSLMILLESGASATKTAEILLESTDGIGSDEKVTAFPAVAGDLVFFTTTSYETTTPCAPFSANLYAFTFKGGPAYDTNNDGQITTGLKTSTGGRKAERESGTTADSTQIFSTAGVRATAPFIVDRHLVFSAGGNIQMFGDPNDFNKVLGQAGVRILSWRSVK